LKSNGIAVAIFANENRRSGGLPDSRPLANTGNTSVLAIAVSSVSTPSATFIRDHIRMIAPGNTILLCRESEEAERLGCPVLSHFSSWKRPRSLRDWPVYLVRYAWHAYIDPAIAAADRRRVIAFLEAHQPKALLAEYGPTGCLLADACRQARVPLYVHFHGADASLFLRRGRWVQHYRGLFREAAGIIVPSRFLAKRVSAIGCPEAKLHTNPCGIDPCFFTPASRVSQQLIAVGRLVEKKAPHLTIAAFDRIAGRYPDARLDIIGDGPLARRCRNLIGRLELNDRVCMHGFKDPDFVAGLMREASIFLQHSLTAADGDCEGLPVAILEAMASALPVVSTWHSGIPEAVEDGITGLLVEERDVEGMAAAIAGLLDDQERGAAMGAAGRRRVLEHFTLEQSRDRLRAIMGFPPLAPDS